jgi:Protein of unknown function (DUF2798)
MPIKYSNLLFSIIMSLLMSLLMSGLITVINVGWSAGYLKHWLHAFQVAWPIGFFCVLLLVKPVRALVGIITKS